MAKRVVRTPRRRDRESQDRESVTLQAIVVLLDRKQWGPDTLDAIADVLRAAGYRIRDAE
jgi:hypothetical protein